LFDLFQPQIRPIINHRRIRHQIALRLPSAGIFFVFQHATALAVVSPEPGHNYYYHWYLCIRFQASLNAPFFE
jgi:hypothetical protein